MDNNSCHPIFSNFTILTSLLMTGNLWTISKSEIGNSVWLIQLSHQVWLFSQPQIIPIRVLDSGNKTKSTMNLVCIYYQHFSNKLALRVISHRLWCIVFIYAEFCIRNLLRKQFWISYFFGNFPEQFGQLIGLLFSVSISLIRVSQCTVSKVFSVVFLFIQFWCQTKGIFLK